MFERRLKLVLLLLLLLTMVLMARAAQMQVAGHDYWKQQAEQLQTKIQLTETTRGEILDVKGRPLAVDIPCTDVAVAYQAILDPPDPKWVAGIVKDRLAERFTSHEFRSLSAQQRAQLQSDTTAQVQSDIKAMWAALADCYRPTDGQGDIDGAAAINEIRRGIVEDVKAQRRWVWYQTFQRSQTKAEDRPRWERWLSGLGEGPDMNDFDIDVSGETEPHVILHDLSPDAVNSLGRRKDRFPGLSLVAATRRSYPMQTVACHLLGRMARVTPEDIQRSKSWEFARQYQSTDDAGAAGIEALCEPLLRGTRGVNQQRIGQKEIIPQSAYVAGQNVTLSIDAQLQGQIQNMLQHVRIYDNAAKRPITPEPGISMHAAAVVIEVKTGEVLALASNPGFDVNDLAAHYDDLLADKLNDPLRDRATCDEFEPGSTVKPMVGLGAITDGLIGPLKGIECTGYLLLPVRDSQGRDLLTADGRPRMIRQIGGRCWIASEYSLAELQAHGINSYAHHPIPYPHRGHDNNPDGFLTFSDALERSCNVYFETVADRLHQEGLIKWYSAFGFGRRTGIGIEEEPGLIPGRRPVLPAMARMTTCFAGIGEGQMWATPLQIANEAATIARGGIWMRPRLLTADSQRALDEANHADPNVPPRVVDLHLNPEALRQAMIGLVNVVNGESGTGNLAQRSDMIVAGKTGSAQGAKLWITVMGDDGRPVLLPDGRPKRIPLPFAVTKDGVDTPTATPWYRGGSAANPSAQHAWFMGFAPADKPEIAFAVLVEYAGAGGNPAAGPIVSQILEAAKQDGYLHPGASPLPVASADYPDLDN